MIYLSKKVAAIKPYFFLNLQNEIEDLKNSGMEIIRLDIGSPDLPPPDSVIQTFIESIQRSDTHAYTPTKGPDYFREAVAHYYKTRFNVHLDPITEITPLLGSKEGIINLHQVLIDPGDEVLLPNPGYPSYQFGVENAGGIVRNYNLNARNAFQLDLKQIEASLTPKVRIVWLNFPNNPTGSTVQVETLQALVQLAKERNFLIINDAPYTDIYYDNIMPPSILSIPGAREIAVEINSLSKTYHMAGWRIGMICGDSEIISALRTFKSKVDNSTAVPIFRAAAHALQLDREWINKRNRIMQQRRDILTVYLQSISPDFIAPQAGFYLWAKIPPAFESDFDFCKKALTQAGVSMTPGSIYGSNGQNYFRISFCQPEPILTRAVEKLKAWYS